MKFDLKALSRFLEVEPQVNPEDPREIEYRLKRPADQLILKIHSDRSCVDIEIVSPNSIATFGATIQCDALTIHDVRPRRSKLGPHIEMELAGCRSHFRSFHLSAPPGYELECLVCSKDALDAP